ALTHQPETGRLLTLVREGRDDTPLAHVERLSRVARNQLILVGRRGGPREREGFPRIAPLRLRADGAGRVDAEVPATRGGERDGVAGGDLAGTGDAREAERLRLAGRKGRDLHATRGVDTEVPAVRRAERHAVAVTDIHRARSIHELERL